jgi:hypothetical protein
MLLKLDLQLFGEDELDIDSMLQEFETEWEDSESEETTEIEQEADQEVEETDETEEVQEAQPNPHDDDAEKRNRAFADLRRQAEENRKYAEFINRLAQDSGVTPEEILNRYQERQLQSEAERQNVPVEFLKESRETQSELSQLKEQLRAERMDAQIESVKSKYGADDDSIRSAFQEMLDSGIDPRVQDNVNFEKFYRAANLETIIQKEVANARQNDLENKKKRQESASIGNGTSVSPSTGNDWSDDDFNAELERLGLRL